MVSIIIPSLTVVAAKESCKWRRHANYKTFCGVPGMALI